MTTKEEILALAGEPAVSMFQDRNGKWQPFIDAQHEHNTRDSMAWHVADFYTANQVIAARKDLEQEVERLKVERDNHQLDINAELRQQLAEAQLQTKQYRDALSLVKDMVQAYQELYAEFDIEAMIEDLLENSTIKKALKTIDSTEQ